MIELWRCQNQRCEAVGKNFEGETPKCPACGGSVAQLLVAVHYLVPAGSDGPIPTGLGWRMIACAPNRTDLPQSSGSRRAVTCPRCIASNIFIEDERDGVDNHVPMIETRTGARNGG